MTWCLEVISGPRTGARFPLHETPLVIGRNPLATLAFPEDAFLSGRHCILQPTSSGILLKDLGSTNGTLLNGQVVTEVLVQAGDLIKVGAITLRLVAESHITAPLPLPVPPVLQSSAANLTALLPSLSDVHPRDKTAAILAHLASLPEPLYCLLDAACDQSIPALLAEFTGPQLCLYEGQSAVLLAQWAPYLLSLSRGSPMTQTLVELGWGKGWTSFFTSQATLKELHHHFRKFLLVEVEGGETVYFRFYDPRVLRDFLPAANSGEAAAFFGPVTTFLVESEQPEKLLRFTQTPNGPATIASLPPDVQTREVSYRE